MPSGEHNKERWAHRLTTSDCAGFSARDLAFPDALPRHDTGARLLVVQPIALAGAKGFAGVFQALRRRQAPRTVRIIPVPQHFGGVRWLLVCSKCSRAFGKLYVHPRFGSCSGLCRRCGNLTYRSRRISNVQRLRAGALRTALHIEPGMRRPTGMHRTTFARIAERQAAYLDRADAIELRGLIAWTDRFQKACEERHSL